jgi:hypothetical protein
MLAARGLDHFGGEAKFRKRRLQIRLEIRAQHLAPARVLAFGGIGDPAAELAEKFTGLEVLADAVDSVGSGHDEGCPGMAFTGANNVI